MVQIRPWAGEDVATLHALEEAAFEAPWSLNMFQEEWENERAHYWVAEDEAHRPLGYAGCWLILDEVHVTNVAVHPLARRRGIGKKLMEQILSFARERAARVVFLEVRQSNMPARNLYRQLKFRDVGKRPHYYENGEDAVLMTLWLNDTAL